MSKHEQGQTGPTEELMGRAEQLIWSLLDENISQDDKSELETMLQDHEAVKELYLNCVQLHTELLEHYGSLPKAKLDNLPNSPVLGSLGDAMPGVDPGSPITD